ncbi:unnamed protein product [Didymodactylos carnosus]|uniref:vitamin-K-epoxide reductase (warfarin-sensitive) n=1 Tax=Didymodactylos carnosus TaxID=1234261 RepID=A0A814K709_9BILA|nr:unnamed protein product [Didymodactylos carnosus]CAF1047404.1 unnamed protein product [Didymodactylos carnosus]CAF3770265.1 unnamed protein product [Didymodactylos carnosus]CAF3817161.1 unnamed protein product [Didymodactylos carnosus]
MSSFYRPIVYCLSIIGILLSLYAFYVEQNKKRDPNYKAACDFGSRASCSRVLTSKYGTGFGIIEGILGKDSVLNQADSVFAILFYLLSIILNMSKNSKIIAKIRVILSLITNLGSIYLGYILYFILNDICVVCGSMYIVNFLLLICNIGLFIQLNKTQVHLTRQDAIRRKKQ